MMTATPCNGGTFLPSDVTLLLTDITGRIEPKPTAERERLIQSGVHYSAMLPLEYEPSERYIAEYYRALNGFARETANAAAVVSEKIYAAKRERAVLVSLARAGTPAGILIKRYLSKKYGFDAPHYTISIVRGRGIDQAAMRYITDRHPAGGIQFIDGWTGKGAILNELSAAIAGMLPGHNKRRILAVLADPANITDICGTHGDFPIASSFLNATVCGLMSRTVIRDGIQPDEFHGAVFYTELNGQDKTYEFIDKITALLETADISGSAPLAQTPGAADITGMDEVYAIKERFGVSDINFIKPGIGEAARVLLRRVPDMLLIAENAETRYTAHLEQLAREKNVPVIRYPLVRYKACGIIKGVTE